ncbi:hypothetical protein [Aureibacter tunicatorum]|uniref:Uncharacterized protein n=1 Tax=Aureibacter tunicatorum TaxID=866807 RepID=A0AAE3XKC9_9BACT|nr:hypothetical protein [Aureibacter tunicatorum]MDR6237593.1 hypothetical protein [Aureibacter tunicatorum]BDD02627.1 hypothetical protein AUTU_01100 [Aureibacter tunicatorum]
MSCLHKVLADTDGVYIAQCLTCSEMIFKCKTYYCKMAYNEYSSLKKLVCRSNFDECASLFGGQMLLAIRTTKSQPTLMLDKTEFDTLQNCFMQIEMLQTAKDILS